MTSVNTKPKTGGDVLIHRESAQANMFSSSVTAAGTANVPQIAGHPVDDGGNLLAVVAFGNATGLLIHGTPLKDFPAGTTVEKYSIVKGNNVVINESALPATDYAGTAIDGAALTALKGAAGLAGFRWVTEAPEQSVQTT